MLIYVVVISVLCCSCRCLGDVSLELFMVWLLLDLLFEEFWLLSDVIKVKLVLVEVLLLLCVIVHHRPVILLALLLILLMEHEYT